MDKQNRNSQHISSRERDENNNHSFTGSEWSSSSGWGDYDWSIETDGGATNSNEPEPEHEHDINKLKVKMAALKGEVKMLKLEQRYAKMEVSLRDEALKKNLRESRQKMDEFEKEFANQTDDHQKQMQYFKSKNQTIMGKLKSLELEVLASQEENKNNENEKLAAVLEAKCRDEIADLETKHHKEMHELRTFLEAKYQDKIADLGTKHHKEMRELRTFLEAKYQDEIAELKAKNQELIGEHEALGDMLKEAEEKAQSKKNQVNGIVERIQQNIQDYAKVMDMEIRLKAREREQQLQLQQPQAQTMAVGTSTSTSDCDQKKKEPDILWSNLVKVKGKKLGINKGNRWNQSITEVTISADGLQANNKLDFSWTVIAERGFPIYIQHSHQKDHVPGSIVYYYEVTQMSSYGSEFCVGYSDGTISGLDYGLWKSYTNNPYFIPIGLDYCILDGKKHEFWSQPEWKCLGNVIGCGLLLDSSNELSIFFTLNGLLLGKATPIQYSKGHIYPAVTVTDKSWVQANFGDNPAIPFKYNIKNLPGMIF